MRIIRNNNVKTFLSSKHVPQQVYNLQTATRLDVNYQN